MYHGFARSAGFDYWQSLGYTFAGSAVWEIAGEQTRPSRNDQVASGIGGTFLGEALFRMSSLVLEHGGGMPRFWREVAATAISPSAGFNRLVFADRYGDVFSSRGAAYFSALRLGYSGSVKRDLGTSAVDFKRNEAQVDFSIDYGLPGSDGYQYTRPFDYFNFQGTLSSANGFENVLTRGLLLGSNYEVGHELPRRLGPLRQLRLHRAADLPRLDHRALARHDRPAVARRRDLAAGHRDGRPRLRRGRHDARGSSDRSRLQLRRRAAGAAGPAPRPRRQDRARPDRARVLRQPASPRARPAATTTSCASTRR